MILSEFALSQRRPSTTNQRQSTITSVERPTEGQGLRPAVAIALGCVLAVVVNLLRPRYETTTGRWRAFYDFSYSFLRKLLGQGIAPNRDWVSDNCLNKGRNRLQLAV